MTAKLRTGVHGGMKAHGSDEGSKHERLMRDHRRPGRREGESLHSKNEMAGIHGEPDPVHSGGIASMGASAAPMPMTGAEGPPGATPLNNMGSMGGSDTEEGDQS